MGGGGDGGKGGRSFRLFEIKYFGRSILMVGVGAFLKGCFCIIIILIALYFF